MPIESHSAAGAASVASGVAVVAVKAAEITIMASLWMFVGLLAVGFSLAFVVVMLLKRPRTVAEWFVALISTLVSSLAGGSYLVLQLGLTQGLDGIDQAELYMRVLTMAGLIFAAGLPGWVLVRVAFNTMTKVQDKSADDIYRDAKELLP